jgi:Mn2+/Fe2+ NRAMP family transporter
MPRLPKPIPLLRRCRPLEVCCTAAAVAIAPAAVAAAACQLVWLHQLPHCLCLFLHCCIAAMELKEKSGGNFEGGVAVLVDCLDGQLI